MLLILVVLEALAIILALSYLLDVKLNWQKGILSGLFIIFPSMLAFILGNQWLMISIVIITSTMIFYFFSKNQRVWMDAASILIGGVLVTHLAQFLLYFWFEEDSFLHGLLSGVLFIILFMAYIYLYKQLVRKIGETLKLPVASKFFVLLIMMLTVLAFYVNIYFTSKVNTDSLLGVNLTIQVLYLVILVIILGVFLYSFNNSYKAKQQALETQRFAQYMAALEEVNRDMQKFRHDYTNILLTIQGYLDKDDIANLKTYFEQSIVKTSQQTLMKQQTLGRLDYLESLELKGLLATKILQAEALGIQISVEVPRAVPMPQMNVIDVARVVGILMDNAIEAAKEIQEGKIRIAIFSTEAGLVKLIIENDFKGEIMNIGQLFKGGYSTKGQGRGVGLVVVKTIINSYSQAMMHTRVEEGKFIQELKIY